MQFKNIGSQGATGSWVVMLPANKDRLGLLIQNKSTSDDLLIAYNAAPGSDNDAFLVSAGESFEPGRVPFNSILIKAVSGAPLAAYAEG